MATSSQIEVYEPKEKPILRCRDLDEIQIENERWAVDSERFRVMSEVSTPIKAAWVAECCEQLLVAEESVELALQVDGTARSYREVVQG